MSNQGKLKLKISDISIDTEADWPLAEDLLNRAEEIENLTPILLNVQSPIVMALDAPWGGGKTTFIRLWQHYLHKEGFTSIYLNAWESDFAEDPLLPLLVSIDHWLAENDPNNKAELEKKKLKELGGKLLKTTAIVAAKVITLGVVESSSIESVIADGIGGFTGDVIDNFSERLSALEKFKECLGKALSALPDRQNNLIVFIDELDRCRPTYAIELLERIKHLFSVDQLVFVLSINKDQLAKSFEGQYGAAFDGEQYLKRFFDFDYQLRKPEKEQYVLAQLKNIKIREHFQDRRDAQIDYENFNDMMKWLVSRFDMSLRDIDQIILRLNLVMISVPKNHPIDAAILVIMIFLRSQNLNLYYLFSKDFKKVNEVINYILGGDFREQNWPKHFDWIVKVLMYSGLDRFREDDLNIVLVPWEKKLASMAEDDPRHYTFSQIVRISNGDGSRERGGNTQKLAYDRIELVHKFDVVGFVEMKNKGQPDRSNQLM